MPIRTPGPWGTCFTLSKASRCSSHPFEFPNHNAIDQGRCSCEFEVMGGPIFNCLPGVIVRQAKFPQEVLR